METRRPERIDPLNKSCCNPDHLEPVTLAENNRRAGMQRTKCVNGHPFTPENTLYSTKGWRYCRKCRYESNQRWKQQR